MKTNVLIPMAGEGSRFKKEGYPEPKPLIPLFGKTMIESVIDNLYHSSFNFIFCISKLHVNEYKLDSIIKNKINDATIVEVDGITDGAACTCLLAKEYINNDSPLIITNCDQIIEDWIPDRFISFCKNKKADGVLGTFYSNSIKNSYVRLNDCGDVIEVREKQIISNYATNGIHYWNRGNIFVDAAEEMINNKEKVNNEFFVAPTYNYLIKRDYKIISYHFNEHYPIGTPPDLESYKKYKGELNVN